MDETTPPGAGPRPGSATTEPPEVDWHRVRDVPRLQRPADRMVAGVCAGLGRHLAIDPLVLRVAFGVLVFFGGAGLLLYGALWLLLPDEGQERAPLHLDERSRGFALVGVTVVAALALVGDSWGLYWFPWPLALLALVAWVLYDRSRDPASTVPSAPYAPAPTPQTGAQAPPQAPDRAPTTPSPAPDPTVPAPAAYAWQYAGTYGNGPVQTRPVPTRPRDPRRRGPVLFWFTLALVVLAMGVLGTLDLAGVAVLDSAYPATALAICAVMLLVGAFWGRAGGIVALGLVAMVATGATMTAERWDLSGTRVVAAPDTSAQVRDLYELNRGELHVDLTDVDDLAALDGRRIRVELGVGRILLSVPEGLAVDLDAAVGGPGAIQLPDRADRGGIAVSTETTLGPDEGPRVSITAEVGVGEIEVVRR